MTLRSWKRWTHQKSTLKDLMQRKQYFTKKMEKLFFQPQLDESNSGGDQELRTSTLVRDHPIRGEGQRDFLGESEGSPPSPPQDSLPDAGEAINDFWSISGNFIYRHHVEPRVKLYSPREESFPIPLKYIDVSRTTHTNLDVMQESRIDDYWNINGSRDLSGSCTGFVQFTLLSEKPPEVHMWSGERLTKRQATSRPDHLWPEFWRGTSKNAKLREKHTWAFEKPKLGNATRFRGIYFIDSEDRSSRKSIRMHEENWKHQWLQPCLARHARKTRKGRSVARLKIASLNLRVSWKPVNPQECVWKNLYQHITRTILQEKETVHCNIIIWYTNLLRCLKP